MTAFRRLPAGLAHPFSPAGRSDPYPAYDWLRANDPVHFDVTTRMWLLTAHEHVASALKDPGSRPSWGSASGCATTTCPPRC